MNVSARYDAFQRDAVDNIVSDFRDEPKGRFLLVVPTGGGKTTTAVKAVSKLYELGLLGAGDRVMWVVHRIELRQQAEDSFARFSLENKEPELPRRIDVVMLSQVQEHLARHPNLKLAIVDEAHHVAARSYQPLVERQNVGILGLTATPSRHDGQPLPFFRESYSIGFPDLVSMGVLLRPNVIRVEGGTYEINDISDESAVLEVLNNDVRNKRILAALLENVEKIHKGIIYVGTRQHARDLYRLLKTSPVANHYAAISIILGDERRRYITESRTEIANETRQDFIAGQKSLRRSLLVNVDVLTEGYDDPTVNTIVMARPTNSKLVYMQALGRAVRIDPDNEEKEAYVVEVVDDLPNVKYRIDNRWLYSDISDLLEPIVSDEFYPSYEVLHDRLIKVFDKFEIAPEHRMIPEYSARDRITMLLFKVYLGPGRYRHIPVVITNKTRRAAAAFFDFLATRMKDLRGLDIEQVVRPVLAQMTQFDILKNEIVRKLVVQSMENAWEVLGTSEPEPSPALKAGRPWISFVAFRLQMSEDALGADLLKFTDDMLNKESVRASLRTASIAGDFVLTKFPLPLRGMWGVFVPPSEFAMLQKTIDELKVQAAEPDGAAQWQAAVSVLGRASVRIEQRHVQSLTTIVREDIDYFRELDRGLMGKER